jgi:hypothetical protein
MILDLAPNLSRTRGQLLLEGNSSQTLFQVMGFTPDFRDEAYKLDVSIDGDRYKINVLINDASLGLSDVRGNISIVPGDVNQIEVDFASKRLHLPTFIPALITATDNKKDPIAVKKRIMSFIELPWQLMSDLKLNFTHRADRVDLQPGNHASTELAFSIENGQLRSHDISWLSDKSDGIAVLIINQLDEDKANADIQLEISSERTPLIWLFTGKPVDVDGERLQFNAKLNSRSKQGIGVSAASSLVPRVRVVRTLAKPQVQISKTEAAVSSGAAIVSSGLAILASGLWGRLRSSVEDPCDALYDRALKDPKASYGLLVNGKSAQGR